MESIKMSLKQVDHMLGSEGVAQSNKVSVFSKSVNDHPYDVLVVRFRETLNEIHGNMCPGRFRQWKWLQQTRRQFVFKLIFWQVGHSLTRVAMSDFIPGQ